LTGNMKNKLGLEKLVEDEIVIKFARNNNNI
jgi:hypothetical protein